MRIDDWWNEYYEKLIINLSVYIQVRILFNRKKNEEVWEYLHSWHSDIAQIVLSFSFRIFLSRKNKQMKKSCYFDTWIFFFCLSFSLNKVQPIRTSWVLFQRTCYMCSDSIVRRFEKYNSVFGRWALGIVLCQTMIQRFVKNACRLNDWRWLTFRRWFTAAIARREKFSKFRAKFIYQSK